MKKINLVIVLIFGPIFLTAQDLYFPSSIGYEVIFDPPIIDSYMGTDPIGSPVVRTAYNKNSHCLIYRSFKIFSRSFSDSMNANNEVTMSIYDIHQQGESIGFYPQDKTYSQVMLLIATTLKQDSYLEKSNKSYTIRDFVVNYLSDSILSIEIIETHSKWKRHLNRKKFEEKYSGLDLMHSSMYNPTGHKKIELEALFNTEADEMQYNSLNFDLHTQRPISFEDLFGGSSARAIIYDYCKKSELSLSESCYEQYTPELMAAITFGLTPEYLLFYPEDEKGNKITKIKIPLSEINKAIIP